MSKQPPPAPTASAIGSCPTIIQTSRTPRHWKFTQHLRSTLPPPGEKDSPTHAASNSRPTFPHLCTKKLSSTCCTCSRGGSLFLRYPIQPHPLSPLIMARLKMTSLETFQSNMIKNTTKRYVDCNAVSWFSICR